MPRRTMQLAYALILTASPAYALEVQRDATLQFFASVEARARHL